MLSFAMPAVLALGVALCVALVTLHLLVQRPASRKPLPTARFLKPDPRSTLRLQSRPTHPLLLLLRLVFVLLVAAAFAGAEWAPARRGTVSIVALDAGAAMAPVWAEAIDSARARLLVPAAGAAGLVVFDAAARVYPAAAVDARLLDSLARAGPSLAAADYAVGLVAARSLAATLPAADSARLAFVTRPRWESWGAGTAWARRAWPADIEVVALEPDGVPEPAPERGVAALPRGDARVVAPAGGGTFVTAALEALGWSVAPEPAGAGSVGSTAALHVLLAGRIDGALTDAIRGGATLVIAGDVAPDPPVLQPWPVVAGAAFTGDVHFADGVRIGGAVARHGGEPSGDARIFAVWSDGAPAAAAHEVERGCVVYTTLDLEAGELPLDPAFPHVIERLADGCSALRAGAVRPSGPLDRGARVVLQGERGAGVVALGDLGPPAHGVPLHRWLLLAALAVLLFETWLRHRTERRHEHGS